jgi:hypothetical protein
MILSHGVGQLRATIWFTTGHVCVALEPDATPTAT